MSRMSRLVLCTIAALSLFGAAQASAASWGTFPPRLDAPYVHHRVITGQYVMANAYADAPIDGYVNAWLYQYYGGAWHAVSFKSAKLVNGHGQAQPYVFCTGAKTPYSWYVVSEVVERRYGHADRQVGLASSRVVTQTC